MERILIYRDFSKPIHWMVLLGFFLALSACGGSGGSGTPTTSGSDPTAPLCDASSAQLIVDLTTPLTNYTWNDPHVLKEGPTTYWMYASATDNFTFPVQLFRLLSTDGVTWAMDPATPNVSSPLLPVGTATGVWDDGGLETPAVVFFNGNYHLFYTTYETQIGVAGHSVFQFRIGHAVSADGVTGWTVDDNPVVSPGGVVFDTLTQSVVGEPAPVVFGGELYLYFTVIGPNIGVNTTLQVIGLIKSTDGVNWSTPVSVLEPSQTVYPRGDGWIGYSTPNAIVHNSQVHLFVDVAYQPASVWTQLRLHHAVSADGETGWVQDTRPLLKRESLAWTAREIRAPSPLDDNGTLRLYFAGDDFPGDYGIGLTSCPEVSW